MLSLRGAEHLKDVDAAPVKGVELDAESGDVVLFKAPLDSDSQLSVPLLGVGDAAPVYPPRKLSANPGERPSQVRRASSAAGATVRTHREGSFWADPLAHMTDMAMLAQPATASLPVMDDEVAATAGAPEVATRRHQSTPAGARPPPHTVMSGATASSGGSGLRAAAADRTISPRGMPADIRTPLMMAVAQVGGAAPETALAVESQPVSEAVVSTSSPGVF